ncbi:hypothetical protein [Acinetobacter bereziniae]|uniref:hypothetical protein n=1 Tax=Acinetobacter bereziniae TaxID=106648 RepID=UPI001901FBBB|nr:hypothetical protein [Acinetobacter bereziniae]MBJ8476475.1 hypothetical protein [Acinetobacter bereziniae]
MSNYSLEEVKQLIEDTKKIHEMHKEALEAMKNNGLNGFSEKETSQDAAESGISVNLLYYSEIKRLRTEIESYFATMSNLLEMLKQAQ